MLLNSKRHQRRRHHTSLPRVDEKKLDRKSPPALALAPGTSSGGGLPVLRWWCTPWPAASNEPAMEAASAAMAHARLRTSNDIRPKPPAPPPGGNLSRDNNRVHTRVCMHACNSVKLHVFNDQSE